MSYKSVIVCDFCGAEEDNDKGRLTFFTVSGQENGKSVSRHMCPNCFTVAKKALMENKIKRVFPSTLEYLSQN